MNSIHLYADTAGDDETLNPDSAITRGAWWVYEGKYPALPRFLQTSMF